MRSFIVALLLCVYADATCDIPPRANVADEYPTSIGNLVSALLMATDFISKASSPVSTVWKT